MCVCVCMRGERKGQEKGKVSMQEWGGGEHARWEWRKHRRQRKPSQRIFFYLFLTRLFQ